MASWLANIAGLFLWILFPTLRQWRSLSAPRTATPWGGAAERGERDPGTVTPPVAASLVEASRNQRPTPNPRGSHWRDPHEWAGPAPTLSLSLARSFPLSVPWGTHYRKSVDQWVSAKKKKQRGWNSEDVEEKHSDFEVWLNDTHWAELTLLCITAQTILITIYKYTISSIIFFPLKKRRCGNWGRQKGLRIQNIFAPAPEKKCRHWRRWRPKSLILFPQQRRKSIFFFHITKAAFNRSVSYSDCNGLVFVDGILFHSLLNNDFGEVCAKPLKKITLWHTVQILIFVFKTEY